MEQSPSESQSVQPVLFPLAPQQLPPRHTPLEQELLEEHVSPSDFFSQIQGAGMLQLPIVAGYVPFPAPVHVPQLFPDL